MSSEPRTTIVTGLRKDRMEALHDGIYAVAMTLLVLDLNVPQGATSFGEFLQQLHGELPRFGAGAIAFSIAGLMWLNHYHRSAMVVRADFTHLALNIAAAGMIVLVPFSTSTLAEYWIHPWGIAFFSWNISLAVILYALAATHYVRALVPKQVDQDFLRWNVIFMWFFAVVTGIIVPGLAFISPLAAVLSIPVFALFDIISMSRMQPRFHAAHRIAQAHMD
jgi:TMEM175 potassium channel family protein